MNATRLADAGRGFRLERRSRRSPSLPNSVGDHRGQVSPTSIAPLKLPTGRQRTPPLRGHRAGTRPRGMA
eukprot:15450340-Alexandrium_andersonii.AAC.1